MFPPHQQYITPVTFSPSDFVYHRRQGSISSLLWSLWLRFPPSIRLSCYRLLWRIAEWHHPRVALRVIRLPFNLYGKDGYGVSVAEAIATQFVSENTTIPVPHILDVISSGPKDRSSPSMQRNFVLSTAIPGIMFGRSGVSADHLTEEKASVFVDTLRGWFDQLRALPPPSHAISGVNGASFFSYRIDSGEVVGPFASQEEFHAQYFCTPWEPLDDRIRAALVKRQSTEYRICFTHGDITPTNILVDNQIRPVGLVDWECAAWMPEYWEYTRAIYIRQSYKGWWNLFRRIFPDYDDELDVEAAIWKHYVP
ncbi:hypothetical protein IW261DRAFT_1490773 [Armillaria novae-zelandiae]|uniref:Aminoglycoside phosphotransferase domain-containing protein n=1 Tax=Armillaria novae-zelandiae TaxID=153914 RepID=A0AA39P2H7_9AGAR|nr:hypothetical protein IW261DRAFT_1490773 [Armillaria novae-zelandiae]